MLVASIILLSLGVAMLVHGLVGRRVGSEPRCRKCKYDLTNLTSDRCPECGVVLGPGAIRTGLRRRRRVSLGIGTCAIILGGAWLAPIGLAKIRAVNWYHALPSTWVYQSALGGSPRALAVLAYRYERGRLDKSLIGQIADTALARQASPTMRFFDPWLDDLLGPMYVNGDLTHQQVALFQRQLLGTPTITVRPKIRAEDTLPLELNLPVRAPRGLPVSIELSMSGDNDVTEHFPGYHMNTGSSGGSFSFPFQIPVPFEGLAPGHYKARFLVEASLSLGSSRRWSERRAAGEAAEIVSETRAPVEAEFDVVGAGATDPLKIVRGPDVDERMKQGLEIKAWLWKTEIHDRLDISLYARKRLPADGIVRIFIHDKSGKGIEYGTRSLRDGSCSYTSEDWGLKPGDRITVRVRGEPEMARNSLDSFDVWDGEIVFSDVPVEGAPSFDRIPERNLLTPGSKLPPSTTRPTITHRMSQTGILRSFVRSTTSRPDLTPVTDPQVEVALRRAISFGVVKTVPNDPEKWATAQIAISTTSMPCDVSFDLFLRCGSREVKVGPFVLPSGASMPANRYERPLEPGCRDGDEVTIVLRPNRELSKRFGDHMTEYWANEMVFGPIRLTRAKSDDTTQVWRFPPED